MAKNQNDLGLINGLCRVAINCENRAFGAIENRAFGAMQQPLLSLKSVPHFAAIAAQHSHQEC
jgi:hypothetical protein